MELLAEFQRKLAVVEKELGDQGRVLVRYSGTEPKCRVMVEGTDEARIQELANDLVEALRADIGA